MNVQKNLDKLALAASQKLKEKDYWTNQLSGEVFSSHFPFDYPHTGVEGVEREGKPAKEMNFRLDGRLYTRMMEIGGDSAFTLHLILTAGLMALLYKYTDHDNIILGTPIYKQAKQGEFINTVLPLRQPLHENITFKDLLLKVKELMAGAVEHQSYPIELLADRLKLSRPNAIHDGGLFNTAILLRNIQDKTSLQDTKPAMIYSFFKTDQGLELEVEYNSRLYRQSTIQRLVRHFESLTGNALANLDLNIPNIPILDEEEKKNLLETFNLTGVGYPTDKTLQRLFAEQAEQAPDNIALVGPGGTTGLAPLPAPISITYRELNRKSHQLALLLKQKGVKPDTIVGIMLERSVDMIIGICGILKAGGAYLPIDPQYPEERIDYMLKDSSARILIKKSEIRNPKSETNPNDQNSNDQNKRAGVMVLNFEHLNFEFVSNFEFRASNFQVGSANLAYIIYTSGTTGKPKGVLIEQKNVVRLFFTDTPRFDFNGGDTWTMFHSPCFDFSVWEMYGALLFGGKLVIISKQTARDPGAFLEVLKAHRVTVLNQTPSAFYSLMQEELTSIEKELNLRYVIFGGEALKPAKLNEWHRKYPDVKLVNMFGITETTVHVTYKEITREEIQSGVSNIGGPLPTLSTLVLDPHKNLLPVGVWGELHVGGEGTARGYINQPELTAEKFDRDLWDYQDYHDKKKKISQIGSLEVKKPGHRGQVTLETTLNEKLLRGVQGGGFLEKSPPGRRRQKRYKSGDLVRVSDDGDLEYHGRIDHQVQVRGFRVELGEIEHRLIRHEDIKEAVVLPADREDGLVLNAYIVPSSPRFFSVQQLKEFLAGELPDYMIPHYFVTVEQIPLTSNGKVDRKALQESGVLLEEEYIPPGNPMEEKLAALWTGILKKEKVGIKENFFDIGGDSIKAIRLANAVNSEFKIDLGVVDLYTHATIGLLAEKIAGDMQTVSRKETGQVTAEIDALKNRITRENDLGGDIEDIYPMSDIEKGIVFYYLKHPGTGLYHDQFVYPIKYRKFQFERLKRAMTLMVQKHSILRTGFNLEDYEQPLQSVYKEPVLDMEYDDISHKNRAEQESYITRFMAMDRKNPFNQAVPPLWRMRVLGIDETAILVLFICHHAILDGWSVASLMTELHNTYLQLHTDPQFMPQPLLATYKDAVIDEIAGKSNPEVIEYWKKELNDYNRLSFSDNLSGDYGYEKMKIFSKNLGTPVLKKLRKSAGTYNTTINHLCFGAYVFIMGMLANENDIVVGYVTNNRPVIPDGDKILGCFLNTVPVRVKISTGQTWAQYTRFIENKILEIKEFERFSLFEIARVIGEKAKDRSPIFDTLFNFKDFHIFQEAHTSNESIETYDSAPLRVDRSEDTNTLFDFEVDITGNSLGLDIKYKPLAISDHLVTQCFTYFKQVIDKLIDEPGTIIRKNDIISSQEKKRLLEEFNDSAAPYSRHKTMHRLFEEQVEKSPGEVSVIGTDGKQQLTYKELNHRANQLAGTLRKRGVIPGCLAAVIMDRSPVMVMAVMGILKAGGAYVPLETYLPDERIRKIMESLKIRTLLTNARQFSKVAKIALELPLLQYIICLDGEPQPGLEPGTGEKKLNGKIHVITPREIEKQPGENPAPSAVSGDIAYIIFTSGSTGTPKGVVETHRPVVNVIEWVNRTFAIAPPDKLLFVASLGFDLSVYDIFGILASGACLRVVSGEDIRGPQVLLDIIMKEGITFWDSAPAALQQLVPFFHQVPAYSYTSRLRLVFLSGDWIPVTMPDALRDTFAGVRVISLGGATEATIWSNYYPIEEVDPSWPSIPYGKPIQNAKYYILDQNLELCPHRVPGDLYIGGQCLATEYINDAQLTAVKFIDNPYAPGEKIYKTGDIARWFEDGNMQFLGRKDHQVKIRGFRVELGEIETQLLTHPLMGDGVVLDRVDAGGNKYLCAYYVLKAKTADPAPDKEELKAHLAGELPEYMIPTFFIPIDKIPLTANGKLDRKALPEPGAVVTGQSTYAAPGNEIQEKLVNIWAEVLFAKDTSHAPIGIDDDFFELGGHSLNATMAASKIHKELNVKIPLAEIFNKPTIRELSARVEAETRAFYAAIAPVEKREYYALASAQMRLYILQQMELDSIAYNIQESVILAGDINIVRLESTFKKLIQRHENLRTSFEMKNHQPIQRIHHQVYFEIQPLEPGEDNFVRPFDLSGAPLMRVGLIKENPQKHIMIVDMHHIVSDGVSHAILVGDFMLLYSGGELPGIYLQYKDYSQWQNSEKEQQVIRQQKDFWLKELAGDIPVLNMPFDYSRPAVRNFEGSALEFDLGQPETGALNRLAQQARATLYMVLAAITNVLLFKICNQEDIIIGTPIAGRRHPDLERIIGMFVNTLALHNYPEGEKSFTDFLQEVRESTIKAFENQDYPFEELVDQLSVSRDASRNPLFDVVFVLQNIEVEPGGIPGPQPDGLQVKRYSYTAGVSKFDLTITAMEAEKNIHFTIEYCTRLFKEETIRRIIDYFKKIVSLLTTTTGPGKKLLEIEILSDEEKARLLYDFNDTKAGFPGEKTIHELFANQMRRTPDHIAVIGPLSSGQLHQNETGELDPFAHASITYLELNQKSDQLAYLLQEKGVHPDTIAGIMGTRSMEMIIGILGILKAGGAYLPIDPDYPRERIDFMLKDSGARVLLSNVDYFSDQLSIVNYQLSMNEETTPSTLTSASTCRANPTNLAYIIYTSGTTGKPKGVLVEHKNVVRLLFNDKFQFDFNNRDVWTLFHSFSFDFSVWEMYGALLYGGQLIIIPRMVARDPQAFLKQLKAHQVTVLNQTPSAFFNLVHEEMTRTGNDLSLRYVIFGGEALQPGKLKECREKYPHTKLVNMFGITETTVHVTYQEIGKQEIEKGISSIGKPIPTLSTYIWDRYRRLAPIGTPGELCVGGEGVARGYLNRPGLTAEKFDRDLSERQNIYKSGDLARIMSDGNMEYLGRIDHQVQIRGFRVELGEIENQLLKHEQIKSAVVIDRTGGDNDHYLCAYIVPTSSVSVASLDIPSLKAYLSARLPEYMIPAYFVLLEEIPLTSHGKVDRKKLPEPHVNLAGNYTAPGNKQERIMAEIWQEVLKLDRVGTHDNFFDVGGDSLKAVVLLANIHKKLNVEIPINNLFSQPTIAELCEYVSGAEISSYSDIKLVEKKEYYPVSSPQKRLYILHQMDENSTRFNVPIGLRLDGAIDKNRVQDLFKQLIRRHENLRTSFTMQDGTPVQRVHPSVDFEMEYREGDGKLDPSVLESMVKTFLRGFNLSHPPLLRVALIKIAEKSYVLVANIHHIVADGGSTEILQQEFRILNAGGELPLLSIHYKDFSEWQNRLTASGEIKNQEQYWLNRFKDDIPKLNMPWDFPRPSLYTARGSSIIFEISRDITARLNQLVSETETTLYIVLLSAYTILLSKYTRQEDIVVGSPVAGRRHADLEKVVGLFINMLPMRNQPKAEMTFLEFLAEVKKNALDAYENQEYPFENLVWALKLTEESARTPLFDAVFAMLNRPVNDNPLLDNTNSTAVENDLVNTDIYDIAPEKVHHELLLNIKEEKGRLFPSLEYSTELYKESTARRMIQHFIEILNQIVNNRDIKLKDIAISHELITADTGIIQEEQDDFDF